MNTIGNIFRFTDFGESHGAAVGGVIDGCPSGISIDMAAVRHDLDRRAGRTCLFSVSERAKAEPDEVEFLSGITDGVTLGTPIAFIIRNRDARPEDYEALRDTFRRGHADMTYQLKYGIRDYRGGGRASARETAARVVAGAIAKQILLEKGISIVAKLVQIGADVLAEDITVETEYIQSLQQLQEQGDSIGGIVSCTIHGLPVGIGEPVFDKLQARLAYAAMSINACKGFEYGSGFGGVDKTGSQLNPFSGGALGGISDGTDFCFRCVFKPTPSIAKEVKGRHDVCIALRTPVIVEAMAAITLTDLYFEYMARK
ncbi:MAG: chorismate synthase [Paludibacteraceae bacterium]|nr:chorismate synthase [Paludibacteraceae bacterium]